MELLIRFTDASSSFTYGVEFGRLLEKIERGNYIVQNNGFPIRIENKEVVISACKTFDYIPIFGEELFGWIEFKAIKIINKN